MVRLGELLTAVTPIWRTSSGKRGKARWMRFCTCDSACSTFVPTLKVTVSASDPSEVDCEDRSSMFPVPLICSSSGAAKVSAITVGFAPGYWARTTTDGGTTSGYSEIGSLKMASKPATKMMIDRTAAKIGRSMKNLEKFMCLLLGLRLARCDFHVGRFFTIFHGDDFRRHRRAGLHPLQTVDHDLLARLDPVAHHAQAIDRRAQLDGAVFGLAVGRDHVDELAVLVGADRAVADQDRALAGRLVAGQLNPCEQARHQRVVAVVEGGAHAHAAGLGVQAVVDEFELALMREAVFIGQADFHADRRALLRHAGHFQVGVFVAVEG